MEFSDYVESRPNAATLTGAEKVPMSQDGDAVEADINEIAAFVGDSAGVVQSVDGDGVDNTDPKNPVITIDPYSYPFPQFTTATSTTAYTGTPSPAITAYATGQKFQVKVHATSTGASTLNLNGLGAKKVYTNPTTQATTGNLLIDQVYILVYDAALDSAAGGFLMVGSGSGGGTVVIGIQDLFIPASAMWPRTTGGCSDLAKSEMATSLFNIQTLDFDQTTQESAQFQVVLPRKWNNGTITFVPYWTASSGSGTVQWALSGGAYRNDDALTVAFGTAQTSDDTLIATNDLHIGPESSAITLAGTVQDADFLGFQITRNPASDTLNADAKLLGVSIRLTVDAGTDA